MKRALIMAGGEGRRMRPFTYTIPKPLLPVGKRPIAEIIVCRLRDCGIRDIIMSLGYGGDLIRAYFQNGSQFGVRISYFQEATKMGTAGCLAHIPELREEPFLISNGDILTDFDYALFLQEHVASGHPLSVATRTEELSIPYGVLDIVDGRIGGVEEKPVRKYCFNAGIYGVSPSAVAHVPGTSPFDMTDLINAVIAGGGGVRAQQIPGFWFDLARVDDFEKAIAQLEADHPDLLT